MADQEKAEAAPSPGSAEAVRSGCTCPIVDNGYGRGYMGQPGVFVVSEGCPLHWPPGGLDL